MIQHRAERTDDNKVCVISETGFTAGNELDLDCTFEQYCEGMRLYRDGKLIQDAFPFLNEHQREFLISGMISQAEWDDLFKEQY